MRDKMIMAWWICQIVFGLGFSIAMALFWIRLIISAVT